MQHSSNNQTLSSSSSSSSSSGGGRTLSLQRGKGMQQLHSSSCLAFCQRQAAAGLM
jgi:hypothetical protein